MKPMKHKISITLDYDIIDDIKVLAELDDRTTSSYINKVLRNHVLHEHQQNKIKEHKEKLNKIK